MLHKDDFEKFFREPTKDKLNTLLKNHTGENNNLEFKEKCPLCLEEFKKLI